MQNDSLISALFRLYHHLQSLTLHSTTLITLFSTHFLHQHRRHICTPSLNARHRHWALKTPFPASILQTSINAAFFKNPPSLYYLSKLSSSQYPNLHRRGPSAGSNALAPRYDLNGQPPSNQSSSSAYVRGAAPLKVDMMGVQDVFEADEYDEKSNKSIPIYDNDAFDDIYSHYTSPTESPASAKSPYHSQQQLYRQQTLLRNDSDNDQTTTTTSSRWDKNFTDSQSGFSTKHFAAAPSISKRTIATVSSPKAKRFSWLPQTWATRFFLLVTLLEAASDVSIETVLLSRFRRLQGTIVEADGNISALPVFVMVFAMAHVYQCFLAIDAVINRNSILVFGLVVFNSAL